MNPLNLPGPEFLAFYVVAFLIAFVLTLVLRRVFYNGGGAVSGRPQTLDLIELAYLAGGAPRVAAAVVASLAQRGSISLDSHGKLAPTADAQTTPGIETLVMNALQRPGEKTHVDLAVACGKVTNKIEAQLVGAGLLLSFSARTLMGLFTWLILLIVPVIGIVKVEVGIERNRPVGFLIATLIVSAIVVFITARPFRRTRAGDEICNRERKRLATVRPAASGATSGFPDSTLLLGVALLGPAALAGTELDHLRRPLQQTGAGTGDGGSSGCSGSSCGGGGGCGGCGGGGD